MVIFATISLVSVAYYTYGKKSTVKAKRSIFALQLAENRLELSKTAPYSAVSSSAYTIHTRYGTQFRRYYAASELYTTDERYKVVAITVTWTTEEGLEKAINLFTLISP